MVFYHLYVSLYHHIHHSAAAAAAGHSLAMSVWGGLSPFMISAIVLLIQPSALAAGLLLVVMGLMSWAAAVPLIGLLPHINARGIRHAPQLILNSYSNASSDPYSHLEQVKGVRNVEKHEARDEAAAAADAATPTAAAAAVAAAGHAAPQYDEYCRS
jgi:hypothetical protein